MKVGIFGSDDSKQILQKKTNTHVTSITENEDITKYDVVFYCEEEMPETIRKLLQNIKIVFVNDVLHQQKDFARFNGWNSFWERDILEVANVDEQHINALNELGIPYILSANEVGMLSPKVIAMIINEAYFAVEEEVSTKNEIDIAMKLGTNYPLGPFEWSEKIGLHRIAALLTTLSKNDERYTPCQLLLTEAAQTI